MGTAAEQALSPARLFFRFLWEAIANFYRNDMLAFAGNMAFMGILAVFPFLIVLISVAGFVGQTEAGYQAIQLAYDQLPDSIVAQVRRPVDLVVSETSGNLLTFSLVIALWTTVRGTAAARAGVMKAYGVTFRRTAHALLSYLIDFGVVFAALFLIMVTLFVLITGGTVAAAAEKWLPLDIDITQYWKFARYGISPLVLYIAIYGLYYVFVPRYEKRRIYNFPGVFLTMIIWFLMAGGFSLYLQYLANLNLLYGSLTGVVVTQLFMYLLSAGFLLGAEFNASITRYVNRRRRSRSGK